jgi:hypothetical protein
MLFKAIAAAISSSVIGGFKSFIYPGSLLRRYYLRDPVVVLASVSSFLLRLAGLCSVTFVVVMFFS